MRVTKFKLNNKLFTLNKEDNKYYSEDGNWANYVEILNDEVIEYDEDSYYCECEERYVKDFVKSAKKE